MFKSGYNSSMNKTSACLRVQKTGNHSWTSTDRKGIEQCVECGRQRTWDRVKGKWQRP